MAGSETESPPPQDEAEEKEIEVVNYHFPKMIDWEDLQQELARLCSLSAEVAKARERKDALSRRIEAIIEAEKEPLQRQNELEKEREELEAKKFAMGDLLLHSKKKSERVRTQRDALSCDIRSLLTASKALNSAREKLQEDRILLAGESGYSQHLKNIKNKLRSRQQYMVTQIAMLYPVKSSGSQIVKENHERDPNKHKSGDHAEGLETRASKSSLISQLSILGVQPITPPFKRMSFFGDKKEAQKSATALGYVAHAVLLIGTYLFVPLRYSLRLGGSRSFVHDFTPCVESTSSIFASNTGIIQKSTEFPLFLEGQETTRAAYAIFLLNKDLEQLLNYVGSESVGPRHILANLKELIRIILSPEYRESDLLT